MWGIVAVVTVVGFLLVSVVSVVRGVFRLMKLAL